jgi:hypothetical protein
MNTPGYYKVNYRAISLGGLARMRGLLRSPLAYLITRFKRPTATAWMPTLWTELECSKQDLSERFWTSTVRQRQAFASLGFSELGFKKLKRILNPLHRDNGGINYLDATRSHFGQLIYNRTHVPAPVEADKEQVTIAFAAVFQQGTLSYTNDKSPFDPLPQHEIVRHPSDDVGSLYHEFLERLKRRPEAPRRFPDVDSLRRWFDSNQLEVFEDRVQRGLFIKMSDAEVEVARRKLPPPLPE